MSISHSTWISSAPLTAVSMLKLISTFKFERFSVNFIMGTYKKQRRYKHFARNTKNTNVVELICTIGYWCLKFWGMGLQKHRLSWAQSLCSIDKLILHELINHYQLLVSSFPNNSSHSEKAGLLLRHFWIW